MINLWFDELTWIAQLRNISDYENKSKEDLINALCKPKPETSKPETPKPEKTKPETPETPKPEKTNSKIEIRVNKKKLKKLRKDFDELRHNFSKKEIGRYRRAFYVVKNKQYLFKSEIKRTNKSFNKLKKVWDLKHFAVIFIALIIIMILLMMMNIEKSEVLEHYEIIR